MRYGVYRGCSSFSIQRTWPQDRRRRYELGNELLEFLNAELKKEDWVEAAKEGRDSRWYNQVTKRAERLMSRLENIS